MELDQCTQVYDPFDIEILHNRYRGLLPKTPTRVLLSRRNENNKVICFICFFKLFGLSLSSKHAKDMLLALKDSRSTVTSAPKSTCMFPARRRPIWN